MVHLVGYIGYNSMVLLSILKAYSSRKVDHVLNSLIEIDGS